jgi:hypothetical protein
MEKEKQSLDQLRNQVDKDVKAGKLDGATFARMQDKILEQSRKVRATDGQSLSCCAHWLSSTTPG